jgi:hypothetical protein
VHYLVDARGNVCREWYLDGQHHREGGPALEWASGEREWWVEGKLHRVDGPAIEYAGGEHEWFLNWLGMSEAAWLEAVGPAKKS